MAIMRNADSSKLAEAYLRLHDIMLALRTPGSGCPWDLEQDFKSIAPYTIEEAYEVADAIARTDMAGLQDELGDLLLQVVYHAQMAAEADFFTLADVTTAIGDKMIRRHPHVFAEAKIADAEAQIAAWEAIKAAERAQDPQSASALSGVTLGLPALLRSQKIQARAARVGFDWPDVTGALDKVSEELGEVIEALDTSDQAAVEDEIGDLLFAVVNVARKAGCDAEACLRAATRKFEARFMAMEQRAVAAGEDFAQLDLAAKEKYWQAAKAQLDR